MSERGRLTCASSGRAKGARRKSLFPNLIIIVVAGQSNGGQFVNHYAASSRFEQEVATPRGIHMRYVVMNPGSYLYFNGARAVPGQTNVFVVPEDCGGYNDWPYGLADLDHAGCSWAYAKRVGARAIREQYPSRNVIYLNGALDTKVEEAPHCEDALQGRHSIEKDEIYFNYLQHYLDFVTLQTFPPSQLHFIPNTTLF